MKSPVQRKKININPHEKPGLNSWVFLCLLITGIMSAQAVGIIYAQPIRLQASWYSRTSLIKEGTWKDGKERKMANGERFDETKATCATNLYPLGTYLKITRSDDSRTSVTVRVTDRIGKRFSQTRVDLSKMAFSRISKLEAGIVAVQVERIK